jgi:uncharacterized small protein (DUF1192 family)
LAAEPQQDNIATALTEVSERLSLLVREEIELAKAEVAQKISNLTRGAAAIAAGAVFGVFAVVFGLLTLAWGLNSLLSSLWVGFGIVFVLLLAGTAGAFLFALRKLKAGAPPAPTMAIDEAKKIRATVTTPSERES